MMKIYGAPISVHTRKAILAARIKQVEHEVVPVMPIVPDTLPADWKRISPTGLIPALEDGDFRLTDSTAIIFYLERVAPTPALLPAGDADLARALALDAWAGSELFRKIVHPLFFNRIVKPKLRGEAPDEGEVREVLEVNMPAAFGYLESVLDGTFLVGGALSLADLVVMSNLVMVYYIGEPIDAARYPKLAGFVATHLHASVVREALEVEKPYVEQMGLDRSFLERAAA